MLSCRLKAPIIAAPPKFNSFKYEIFSKVTPPNATTLSSMIPLTLASLNISSVNADLYPTFEKQQKDGTITEDDLKTGEADLQKSTDKYIQDINKILEEKEKEIMEG